MAGNQEDDAEREPTLEERRTMLYWLARTLKATRKDAEQRYGGRALRPDIARVGGVSESTLSRFEERRTWPRDLDKIIAAYAALCGIEDGRTLWKRALADYLKRGSAPTIGELTPARRAVLLALEAAQRQKPNDDESPSTPNAIPKPRRSR